MYILIHTTKKTDLACPRLIHSPKLNFYENCTSFFVNNVNLYILPTSLINAQATSPCCGNLIAMDIDMGVD